MLGENSSRQYFKIFFFLFSKKIGDNLHEIPKSYFLVKNVISLSSAEFAYGMVKIKINKIKSYSVWILGNFLEIFSLYLTGHTTNWGSWWKADTVQGGQADYHKIHADASRWWALPTSTFNNNNAVTKSGEHDYEAKEKRLSTDHKWVSIIVLACWYSENCLNLSPPHSYSELFHLWMWTEPLVPYRGFSQKSVTDSVWSVSSGSLLFAKMYILVAFA